MDSLYIYVPIVLATTLHMFLVKYDALSALKIPISKTMFGENKTWRGFIFVPLSNAILMGLLNLFIGRFEFQFALLLGIVLGFGYILFELPNSFVKRRLGIPAGKKAQKNKWLFILTDRLDSALGVVLFYKFMVGITWLESIFYIVLGMVIHFSFSLTLYLLKIKKSL